MAKSKFRNGYDDYVLGMAFINKKIKTIEHSDGSIDVYIGDDFVETFKNKSYYNTTVARAKHKALNIDNLDF